MGNAPCRLESTPTGVTIEQGAIFFMTNSAAASGVSRPPLSQEFDAIVVGAGAAGLYSALCLPSSLRVGLLTKDDLPPVC